MIDQRRLPESLEVVSLQTHLEVAEAIRNMTVRGAPAIGVAAAFGLVLAAKGSKAHSGAGLLSDLKSAAETFKKCPSYGGEPGLGNRADFAGCSMRITRKRRWTAARIHFERSAANGR